MRAGGWALAWTTDLEASPWARWSGFSPFWGGLVREHLRRRERGLDLRAEVVDGQLHAETDALGPDRSFDDALASSLELSAQEPRGSRRLRSIRQTAPGRYEAWFPLAHAEGSHELRIAPVGSPAGVDTRTESRVRALSPRAVHLELPTRRERRELGPQAPDLEKLQGIARAGGGDFGPALLAPLLDPAGQTVEVRELLWPRLVQLALGLLLFEAMLRIVRRGRTRKPASGAS